MQRDNYRGFSLVELMIVVAIMLLIAAIAIPNLLRARISANESSAAAALRTIATSQISYFNAFPTIGYAANLPNLGGVYPCNPAPANACLVDPSLANAIPGSSGKSGYQFQTTGINNGGVVNGNYVSGATPLSVGLTGNRDFCGTDMQVYRMQVSTGGLPVNTLAACQAYPLTN